MPREKKVNESLCAERVSSIRNDIKGLKNDFKDLKDNHFVHLDKKVDNLQITMTGVKTKVEGFHTNGRQDKFLKILVIILLGLSFGVKVIEWFIAIMGGI